MSAETKCICGKTYLDMLKAGAARLAGKRTEINDLNVFPIPDGDTGDNMLMTLQSGCSEASGSDTGEQRLDEISRAASHGMLLGARGNSGVILSRIFAGMAKGLEGIEEAGPEEWARAMEYGVRESYSSVSTPVEGTILTVFREAVAKAGEVGPETLEQYFTTLCKEADLSLERTPELLPVLKDAGVVDSGGAGLVCILEGMKAALYGEACNNEESPAGLPAKAEEVDLSAFSEDSVLEFGYCTEFLLRLQRSKVGEVAAFDETPVREYLQGAGESLVFFREGSIIKVHIHTPTPGDILSTCQRWGEFLTVKVENMTLQHHGNHMDSKVPAAAAKGRRKPYAVVAVVSGDGLCNIFRDNGADFVIEGGQTMNPSAEDFIKAFESVNAERIFVLPNNSNIILTAIQASQLYKGSEVHVIRSRSIGEGYMVLGSVDFSGDDAQALTAEAGQIAESVTTGMVSTAIRDSGIASAGDFIGFRASEILSASKDRSETASALCDSLGAEEADVIVIFKGQDVPQEEADALCTALQGKYRKAEIALCDGGQKIFDYILILE